MPAQAEPLRYTLDGDEGLETHLRGVCSLVRKRIGGLIPAKELEAVLLGGGYGRGEGGVLRSAAGDRPYNDMEFYVALRGHPLLGERRRGAALHHLAETLTPEAGVEVEFKIMSLRHLRHSPVTLFSHDLVAGHRWVIGDESLLAGCEHHRDASRVPLDEATRLLMNRCSGLLFARKRLQSTPFTAEDADFAGRNLSKARLALGDVLLLAAGLHNGSCRERNRILNGLDRSAGLPALDNLLPVHAEAVAFKLRPTLTRADQREDLHDSLEALVETARAVWLWLESRRLGRRFDSMEVYAFSEENKFPEKPAWHNLLVQAREAGRSGRLPARVLRYPREHLCHALAFLLWEPADIARPATLRHLQRQLGTTETSLPGLLDAYAKLWCRFR